jgi:hypothetical protein
VTEALLLLSTLLPKLMNVPHYLPVLPLKIFDQLAPTLFKLFFSLALTQQRNKLERLSRGICLLFLVKARVDINKTSYSDIYFGN